MQQASNLPTGDVGPQQELLEVADASPAPSEMEVLEVADASLAPSEMELVLEVADASPAPSEMELVLTELEDEEPGITARTLPLLKTQRITKLKRFRYAARADFKDLGMLLGDILAIEEAVNEKIG